MRLRTLNHLQDFIDGDLTWRRREMSTARFAWQNSKGEKKAYACRVGVCLAYAHWEGFVKTAAMAYLNFVAHQGLKFRDLTAALIALCLRGRFTQLEAAQRITLHAEVAGFFLSGLDTDASVPWEQAVSQLSNLDFATFTDVTTMIGVDPTPYSSRGLQIDGVLVKNRHLIAHGSRVDVDELTCEELHELVIELLDRFRTDVENAASTGAHLRLTPQGQRN